MNLTSLNPVGQNFCQPSVYTHFFIDSDLHQKINQNSLHFQGITFHRAGEKLTTQPRVENGLHESATDWKLEVDLGKQLKFPARITSTRLRPDMIVRLHHAVGYSGAHSALERTYGQGYREESCQVPGAGGRVQEERLENSLWASGGGLQRIWRVVTLQSVHAAVPHQGAKKKAIIFTTVKPQKKPQGSYGSSYGQIRGQTLLGHGLGFDQLGFGRLGDEVWCWKTQNNPKTPGYITDDESLRIGINIVSVVLLMLHHWFKAVGPDSLFSWSLPLSSCCWHSHSSHIAHYTIVGVPHLPDLCLCAMWVHEHVWHLQFVQIFGQYTITSMSI